MHWAALVFGWPGALGSIALSTAGLVSQRAPLVFAGALVGLPFMAYLFATPRFWLAAAIAAPCHLAAAFALALHARGIAWLLFVPTLVVVAGVAALVR